MVGGTETVTRRDGRGTEPPDSRTTPRDSRRESVKGVWRGFGPTGAPLLFLNVTERRPKWLLSQVHPDKHPDFSAF